MIKTVSSTISFPSLPAGFRPLRIVQLSDLHGQFLDDSGNMLAERVRSMMPHLVAMTGDMVNAGTFPRTAAGRRAFLIFCRTLAAFCQVYYSLGNHELEMPAHRLEIWLSKVARTGVCVLNNTKTEFIHGTTVFPVLGLNIPLLYYKNPLSKPYDPRACWTAADMDRVFGPQSPDRGGAGPSLLLAHNPLYFPAYRDWGADITLSGHIHGGIIRLPILGGVLSPDLSLFPKYDGGLFSESSGCCPGSKKHLVVSRGLSDTFLRRVANPMEIVCLTIRKGPAAADGKRR